MNIEDLEKYLKEKVSIPFVNFKGLDLQIAQDIVEALNLIYERYPALKNSIFAIGFNEDINNLYSLLSHYNNPLNQEDIHLVQNKGQAMNAVAILSKKHHIEKFKRFETMLFIGIAINDTMLGIKSEDLNLQLEESAKNGYHPKHYTTVKSHIYHEIGHILDYILNLSLDKKLTSLIFKHSEGGKSISSKISKYVLKSESGMRDLITEAFSEYITCPDANDLIHIIGTYIDKKYYSFENSDIFRTNQKFSQYYIDEKASENKRIY